MDRIHAAMGKAWALLMRYRIVRTHGLALSALDALLLIDDRASVLHRDRSSWTDFIARVRKTAHTFVSHLVSVFRAGIARRRDHLHQRRLIIFLIDIALLHALADLHRLILRAERHSHRKPRALPDDLALPVYIVPIG